MYSNISSISRGAKIFIVVNLFKWSNGLASSSDGDQSNLPPFFKPLK
jgi:hypothetical protein